MLQFKVAKNVVGDRRLTMIMRPENLEMKIFLEYNLIALNYSVLWKACSQCQKHFDALTARKVTQEIQTRDPMMEGWGAMVKKGEGEFAFFIGQIRKFSLIFDFGISILTDF